MSNGHADHMRIVELVEIEQLLDPETCASILEGVAEDRAFFVRELRFVDDEADALLLEQRHQLIDPEQVLPP